MADGNPPTSIGRSATPPTGSRRCTVPSMLLATQMPLEDAATAMGPLPTAIVCTTVSDSGSICDTVRASAFATHTASSPIARLSGSLPTSIVSTTAPDDGSILETVPSAAFATHTASSVATTALGRLPTGIADLSRPLAGSKRPRLFGATVVSPTPRTLGTTIAVVTSASATIAADATRSRFRRGVSGAILPRRCRASSASSGAALGVPSTAVAAKTPHASSTPFSWRIPRSSNRKPAPRESSAAVLETSTSPAPPSAMIRAPTTTVIPPSFLPIRSHSPKWTPARISTPRSRTASAIAAGAGDRRGGFLEACEEAVPGGVELGASEALEFPTDDPVVGIDEGLPTPIAKLLRDRGALHHVREQDRCKCPAPLLHGGSVTGCARRKAQLGGPGRSPGTMEARSHPGSEPPLTAGGRFDTAAGTAGGVATWHRRRRSWPS